MTRKSRIRSKRSVSRKIRGSRRRVQKGGDNEQTVGQQIDHYTESAKTAVEGAVSDVKGTVSNLLAPSGTNGVTGAPSGTNGVTTPVEPASWWDRVSKHVGNFFNKVRGNDHPDTLVQGQVGGKRRRHMQTHIRLNRKYISRKMNNIVDIFRKHLTCKNKGKNKKSRRNYRGGAYGKYPGAVGSIDVPMQSRP